MKSLHFLEQMAWLGLVSYLLIKFFGWVKVLDRKSEDSLFSAATA